MPQVVNAIEKLEGLSSDEAMQLQHRDGRNLLVTSRERKIWHIVRDILGEPMFILLIAATTLYFLIGQWKEGYMTLVAVMLVTAISLYQDMRSSHALEALNRYTQHKVKAIRDGMIAEIAAEDLVKGDLVLLEEGDTVPGDAELLQGNDVSVDEAIITGESLPVSKSELPGERQLLQGTTLGSGSCYARITAIGADTVLGRLGKSVSGYSHGKTLLQEQVGVYVRRLALFGAAAFILIFGANYLHGTGLAESLLMALTLAMAAIPEEIPVAFSSFMALGAYQLSRLGIIVRRPQVTENLGAVSVICLDKTGTITENKMVVSEVYQYENGSLELVTNGDGFRRILLYARMASEKNPFDAMETAIIDAYRQSGGSAKFNQVYEYPLEGRPPMMTHIHHIEGTMLAAGKGAAERILQVCRLDRDVSAELQQTVSKIAAKGYRVLGVAGAVCSEDALPDSQDGFKWTFYGFVCLNDPPKAGVDKVISSFYKSGIAVKLLTGDYLETALNIAGRTGINNQPRVLTGTDVMNMNDRQLQTVVPEVSVFARMFPEAKERVVKALQARGELVAMTGDGVNDAPALKAADIGIAMGQRGTTTAREVADVVITDDNLARVVDAITQGRKIFANLKKSIRYIISIHIPIILTAALPVLLGWKYPNIFTPIHVIFLS
ncbi:HAD-IC family P-type ATPase [Chitinophaga sedimenti]|uniref:cation-translocating P-type ATPase n=1 Tax=Chitinophaga sedimenti TaxID=2033606 RepID=UPI002005558D|nr:HAD-IC family P-type ATPase [Chitinophaga sedimenti]MCK7557171.1 HAD-IC family P-type ATPase [Chitinophaga sedimenti]